MQHEVGGLDAAAAVGAAAGAAVAVPEADAGALLPVAAVVGGALDGALESARRSTGGAAADEEEAVVAATVDVEVVAVVSVGATASGTADSVNGWAATCASEAAELLVPAAGDAAADAGETLTCTAVTETLLTELVPLTMTLPRRLADSSRILAISSAFMASRDTLLARCNAFGAALLLAASLPTLTSTDGGAAGSSGAT